MRCELQSKKKVCPVGQHCHVLTTEDKNAAEVDIFMLSSAARLAAESQYWRSFGRSQKRLLLFQPCDVASVPCREGKAAIRQPAHPCLLGKKALRWLCEAKSTACWCAGPGEWKEGCTKTTLWRNWWAFVTMYSVKLTNYHSSHSNMPTKYGSP